jgi:hypothetical protein
MVSNLSGTLPEITAAESNTLTLTDRIMKTIFRNDTNKIKDSSTQRHTVRKTEKGINEQMQGWTDKTD